MRGAERLAQSRARRAAACSLVGAMVMVGDLRIVRHARSTMAEVLEIGSHRLHFLATPHVPHCWDAGLFFEEKRSHATMFPTSFSSGDPEPLTEADVVGRARESIIEGNEITPGERHGLHALYRSNDAATRRFAARTLALMHGFNFSWRWP